MSSEYRVENAQLRYVRQDLQTLDVSPTTGQIYIYEDDHTGFLKGRTRFARTGVQTYTDGKDVWNEYRSHDQVFETESMLSWSLGALTFHHKNLRLNRNTAKEFTVGWMGSNVKQDGDFITNDFCISDPLIIDKIKEGEGFDFSAEYKAEIVRCDGTHKGTPYQARQEKIRVVSVAVVPRGSGRAGPECSTPSLRSDSHGSYAWVLSGDPAKNLEKNKGDVLPAVSKNLIGDLRLSLGPANASLETMSSQLREDEISLTDLMTRLGQVEQAMTMIQMAIRELTTMVQGGVTGATAPAEAPESAPASVETVETETMQTEEPTQDSLAVARARADALEAELSNAQDRMDQAMNKRLEIISRAQEALGRQDSSFLKQSNEEIMLSVVKEIHPKLYDRCAKDRGVYLESSFDLVLDLHQQRQDRDLVQVKVASETSGKRRSLNDMINAKYLYNNHQKQFQV